MSRPLGCTSWNHYVDKAAISVTKYVLNSRFQFVWLACILLGFLFFFNMFNGFTADPFLGAFITFFFETLFTFLNCFLWRFLVGLTVLSALFIFIPCIFLFTSSLVWSVDCCIGETKFTVTFSSCPPVCEGPTDVINCWGLPNRDPPPICFHHRCA